MIYNNNNTHIDHHYEILPFKQLLIQFLDDEQINLADVETVPDGTRGRKLNNNELQKKFETYHKDHANLRAIAKEANIAGPIR